MPVPPLGSEYYNRNVETRPYAELEALQLRKIRRVVKYAYHQCAFYHRTWKAAGVSPSDVETLDDFRRKIPSFTKDDLRAAASQEDITGGITSCEMREISNYAMTSGTTGINTFIGLSSRFLDEFVEEHAMREYWMAKMRPGMRVFMVPAGWHFFGIAQNMVLTRMGVACESSWGSLFHRFIPQLEKALATLKGDYLVGMPWAISALFDEAGALGTEPSQLFDGIEYISLAGEPLFPGLRRKLMRETGVKDVFESGGSVDGLWGGGDCYTHTGNHIWMDSNLIEIVDFDGKDQIPDESRGQVVSTNLRLGGPLYVRFRGEDLAKKVTEKCACGRTHARVKLYDRLINSFRVRSEVLTPYDVASLLNKVLDYRPFTIVNPGESTSSLRVMIAKGRSDEDYEKLSKELDELSRRELGIGMDVRLVGVRQLPFRHRKFLQIIRDVDWWSEGA